MKSLIQRITETITETLREQLKTVPKTSITTREKSEKVKTPGIIVSNPEFAVAESSLSGSEPERKETREEKFSGDGRSSEFTLTQKAARPVTVEYPVGEPRREPDDYSVDYTENKVKFRTAPDKGKANIIIRYTGARSSAELRSLQLNLKYLIEVSGEDGAQRDEVTLDVLRALVIAKELLEREGVNFRIQGGRNDENNHESGSGTSSLKSIECLAETKLTVEMPTGVMEKILLEKLEQPASG